MKSVIYRVEETEFLYSASPHPIFLSVNDLEFDLGGATMAISIAEFDKALASLSEALNFYQSTNESAVKAIARDACIQRFEFCIELSWKTSGKILGSPSVAANTVIREMAREGLIQDPELWFGFIAARNLTSHTYDEKIAVTVMGSVQAFLPHAQKLLTALKLK